MSIHSSLKGIDTLAGERSVLTRVERIQKLIKEGRLGEDSSAYGLPKVRTKFKVAKVKKEKKESEDDETKAEGDEEAAAK